MMCDMNGASAAAAWHPVNTETASTSAFFLATFIEKSSWRRQFSGPPRRSPKSSTCSCSLCHLASTTTAVLLYSHYTLALVRFHVASLSRQLLFYGTPPAQERSIAKNYVSVCLSVHEHISGTARPSFTKISCACYPWPLLGPFLVTWANSGRRVLM